MSQNTLLTEQCEMDATQIAKGVELGAETEQGCLVMNQDSMIPARPDAMDVTSTEEEIPATIRHGAEDITQQQQTLEMHPRHEKPYKIVFSSVPLNV